MACAIIVLVANASCRVVYKFWHRRNGDGGVYGVCGWWFNPALFLARVLRVMSSTLRRVRGDVVSVISAPDSESKLP